ncbi:MAG: DUF1853 family protein [Myxococcota bacterium]|nr:DUF1853 family protein [Myxococcota bacterium]
MRKLLPYLWQLRSSIHRDLAWLIASPSLLAPSRNLPVISSEEWWSMFLDAFAWIQYEDQNPDSLARFIDTPRQYKLGLYAEDLMLYYLEQASPYTVLAHDLQIFQHKRSIGAFDFIIKTPKGTIEHWEMAIKYFLQYEPIPDWSAFVGPGGRDTLRRKMDKILCRQILLGDTPEAKKQLHTLGIPHPQSKRVVSVGKLFGQWNSPWSQAHSGDSQQPTGKWIFQKDLRALLVQKSSSRWKILLHPKWLAPIIGIKSDSFLCSATLRSILETLTHHMMLAELHEGERGWEEHTRWMVVPNHWTKIVEDKK